jgi:fluoroquinolone transport system permease protein
MNSPKSDTHQPASPSILVTLMKFDVHFQVKQGFYLVYALVSALYIVILFNISFPARSSVTAYLILSDTSIIGITFMGALVLLEKQQNILQSLFVTPVKLEQYLWSKAVSLTLLALLASALIAFVPGGLLPNWPLTLIAVTLSSLFFSFVGLGISASAQSLNDYLAGIMLGGLILCVPLVLFFYFPLLSLIFPINCVADLLLLSPGDLPIIRIVINCSILVIWIYIAYRYAFAQFNKHVINK